jgi:hypothetical protein
MAVVMVGDIRISIGDPPIEITEFGVKKIHHVAETIYAGFAGSVVLGFRLINHLALHLEETFDPFTSTINLTEHWASTLPTQIAPLVPSELAAASTHLIVAGFHLAPVNNEEGTSSGEHIPFGSGCIVRLPEPVTGIAEVERFAWQSAGVSVGSGSVVPQCGKMLKELDWLQLSNWSDPALVMSAIMKLTIESAPTFGVSTDLIAMLMKLGPNGIVGSGRTFGDTASDRSLIADNEGELYRLWDRFAPLSGATTTLSIRG